MDHKREDQTPPTSKGHGSGYTTAWESGLMIVRVELYTMSDCIVC